MLEGDYSSSDSEGEQPSAAPHVDREKVVGAINDHLGADYSEKYHLSTSIYYNLKARRRQNGDKNNWKRRCVSTMSVMGDRWAAGGSNRLTNSW
jgi:hypothetical protein